MMALISLASMPNWIWYTLIALLGAGVGGYLIHLIYTLPYQMMLEWQAEMIQVLNPIILDNAQDGLLTGFGSSYHQKVAPAYLYAIIIPLSALLSVGTLAIQGISIIGALSVIFVWFGLGLAGIDYRVQLLPDRLVLPLGMIGLMANGFGILTTPTDAIFGAVVGFLVLWLINALYRLVHRQDGMGAWGCQTFVRLRGMAWCMAAACDCVYCCSVGCGGRHHHPKTPRQGICVCFWTLSYYGSLGGFALW